MTPGQSRLYEWRGFIAFIVVMLLFRSAIADWNQVPSGSMLPAILVGDRIVVDKLAYDLRVPFTRWRLAQWRDPARGDVVTFVSPEDERLLVKRVIGLPGDLIELSANALIVNGEYAEYRESDSPHRFPEHRLLSERIGGGSWPILLRQDGGDRFASNLPPLRIPPGHYLLLGDNRDNSRDSRTIGFVARERIMGRATTVAFSLDYDNFYAPRLDRFMAELP